MRQITFGPTQTNYFDIHKSTIFIQKLSKIKFGKKLRQNVTSMIWSACEIRGSAKLLQAPKRL